MRRHGAGRCADLKAGVGQTQTIGDQTDLRQLHALLLAALQAQRPGLADSVPVHQDFRAEDVRHSRADVSKAARLLG